MLEEMEHTVLEAGSGEQALEIMDNEDIRLLITDLGLPGMSGEDLGRRVRIGWPQVAIIFATGQNAAPDLPDPSTVGLLSKPYGPEEIADVIAKVTQSGR
jgi:CheY-like chemotaxis protein